MRYPDSVPQCGEYLRLTIPFLTQKELPANPVNYALGFEMVSSMNEGLNQAFAELVKDGSTLTAVQSQQLFDAHIAQPGVEEVAEANDEFGRVLGATQSLVQEMAAEGGKYQDSLEREGPKLEQCSNPGDLQKVIDILVADTRAMRESNEIMNSSLAIHIEQIADLRAQLNTTRKAAKVDSLTGLQNRGAFDDLLAAEIEEARLSSQPLALVMLDIDHFKKINDSMGHLFGDRVIKAVARAIVKQTRGQDTAARIGGEEYAVILPNTDYQGAQVVAENIRKAVEKIVLRKASDNERLATVTLSGGVAQLQDDDCSESLLQRSDDALYAAKNGGRNQIMLAQAA
ncbi:MAG: hypothetical protein DRQ52_00330 [Gammaproteobacteria bacterium]|nr:MAG: hypothetical protein DRQ52_00330 [Gammaproteobacteria bacterium]